MTHTEAVNMLATERYLLEEMTESERNAFEEHYFSCLECAEDVRTAGVIREGVEAGFAAPSIARVATFVPAQKRTVARPPWYQSTVLPWAIAATLAIAVTYQARPTRNQSAAPQVLTPITLRPASRGAIPAVSLGAGHVALALDVDIPSGATELSYELRDPAGQQVFGGRTLAPPQGSPLLLVIPGFTLNPEQQYILTVREGSAENRALGEYHFAATR
jgi:anti-sigma factor RsiW